jgi:sec-independent protein translocase protein TatA
MDAIFLLGMPGGSEMLIVLFVVVLLFGGSRLPQLAKGLGESIKEFKKSAAQGDDDDEMEVAARRRRELRDEGASGFGAGQIARDRAAASEWR